MLGVKLPGLIQPAAKRAPFLDLRKELSDLYTSELHGMAFSVIHRHADKQQHTTTYDPLKREAHQDNQPQDVWNYWDTFEKTVKCKYIGQRVESEVGMWYSDSTLFFFAYDLAITEQDRLIEIVTNDSGEPVYPIKYVKQYIIKDVEKLRGNSGRSEFTRVYANKSE